MRTGRLETVVTSGLRSSYIPSLGRSYKKKGVPSIDVGRPTGGPPPGATPKLQQKRLFQDSAPAFRNAN